MDRRSISVAAFCGLALASIAPAHSDVALRIDAGQLIGATGVMVGGVSYDVQFVDGTCDQIFGECKSAAFAFNSAEDASLASKALMDQVFNETFSYYDQNPARTRGCEVENYCVVFTPYAVSTDIIEGDWVYYKAAFNGDDSVYTDHADGPEGWSKHGMTVDWSVQSGGVVAVWTPTPPSQAEITPVTTDFGRIVVSGGKSANVTVRNMGTTALSVIEVAGADALIAPFSIASENCSERSLAPGDACSFTIHFVPQAVGEFTDSYSIVTDDPVAPLVRATARGTAVSIGGQILGIREPKVTCVNKKRKSRVSFTLSLEEQGQWDCQTAGLVVGSGDGVVITIEGSGE